MFILNRVEIVLVVPDSLEALNLYEKIFDIERIDATNFSKGENEAIFAIGDVVFHLLDENPEYRLISPKLDAPKTSWVNVVVEDIHIKHVMAIELGCKEMLPVTESRDVGMYNSVFMDPFGYVWMLHQNAFGAIY